MKAFIVVAVIFAWVGFVVTVFPLRRSKEGWAFELGSESSHG